MKIKNIKEFGISQGLLKEGKKGIDYLLPVFKRFFNYSKVPFYDDCCNEIGEAGLPVGYKNNTLQYYDNITKQYIAVPIPIPPIVPPVPLLMFENNAAAIAGGLTQGQQYYLPLNNGSYVVAVVIVPALEITFNNDKVTNRVIGFEFGPVTQVSVDWGDGSLIETLTDSGTFNFIHSYPSNQIYTAKVILDDYSNLYTLDLGNQEVNFVTNTSLLIGIRELYLSDNNLTTIPTIVNNPNLTSLYFNYNNITEESINDTLVYLNNTFISPFIFNSLNQILNTGPSGVGITAKNNLIGNGCSILTN